MAISETVRVKHSMIDSLAYECHRRAGSRQQDQTREGPQRPCIARLY
jgi:hypothetical protein